MPCGSSTRRSGSITGDTERDWLEFAAILHDIGYLINERSHHKHTYYLITNSELGGLSSEELMVIANIARYHRRAHPHSKHETFDVLTAKLQRSVRVLSALLRIADGLDRTHFSVVKTVDVKVGATIKITAHVTGDAELEAWAAKGRADLFERIFRRRVQLTLKAQEDEA